MGTDSRSFETIAGYLAIWRESYDVFHQFGIPGRDRLSEVAYSNQDNGPPKPYS